MASGLEDSAEVYFRGVCLYLSAGCPIVAPRGMDQQTHSGSDPGIQG